MRKSRAARLATQPEALHDRPGGHTVKVRYFTSDDYIPPALLRRVEFVDEAFVAAYGGRLVRSLTGSLATTTRSMRSPRARRGPSRRTRSTRACLAIAGSKR